MKKIVRLTEIDLNNLIKHIISEMEFKEAVMSVEPFSLSATQNGNIKITNTKTRISHEYSMEAWKGIGWFDCTIIDFPGGTKIKLKAMSKDYIINVNKSQIQNLLQTKFGNQVLNYIFVDNSNKQEVKFTKVV